MLRKVGRLTYLAMDLLLVNAAFLGSLLLRFDGIVPEEHLRMYLNNGIYITAIAVLVFAGFGLYKNLWRYTSVYEIINIVICKENCRK